MTATSSQGSQSSQPSPLLVPVQFIRQVNELAVGQPTSIARICADCLEGCPMDRPHHALVQLDSWGKWILLVADWDLATLRPSCQMLAESVTVNFAGLEVYAPGTSCTLGAWTLVRSNGFGRSVMTLPNHGLDWFNQLLPQLMPRCAPCSLAPNAMLPIGLLSRVSDLLSQELRSFGPPVAPRPQTCRPYLTQHGAVLTTVGQLWTVPGPRDSLTPCFCGSFLLAVALEGVLWAPSASGR